MNRNPLGTTNNVQSGNTSQWGGTNQTGADLGKRLFPTNASSIFNTAIAGSTTDFFASALTATQAPSLWRCQIAVDTATTVSARITRSATTVAATINNGGNMVANAGFGPFDILTVNNTDTLNFRSGAALTILFLFVEEIPMGQ